MTLTIGTRLKVIDGSHGCECIVGQEGTITWVKPVRDEVIYTVAIEGWYDDGLFYLFEWQVEKVEPNTERNTKCQE